MKEKDIRKAILGRGLKQGILTVEEIHEALPVGPFSLDRMEDLMALLDELGVRVVDCREQLN